MAMYGGTMKKGLKERDIELKGRSAMKRDRGYETCPNNPTDKLRGTDSPAHK